MKRASFITALLISACSFTSLFAAGVDLTGVGARATALGGNYRAVSDDWSAMFWNPAGMAFSKGWKVGASLEFVTPVVGYTPKFSLAGQQFSATSSQEIENEPKTFTIPAAGIYYSNEKFAAGLAFWAPFGLGAKWDLLNTQTYNNKYPEYDFEDDLMIVAVQPTVAYRVSDKFSLGLGASLTLADIMIRKPNFTPNPYIYNQSINALVSAAFPAAALSSPFDHLLTETELQGDGMSFGVNLGAMYKITPCLNFGASMRFYNDIPLEGTVTATNYFANLPAVHGAVQAAVVPTLTALKNAGQITQQQFDVLANYYSGAVVPHIPETDVKADMPLPMNIGAGIAYTGVPRLLVTADVAWSQWSAWDVIDINDTDGNPISALVQNWEDGIRAGVGLEYNVGFGFLRGAYYTEPRAAVNETMTPAIPDANRRHVANIGFELPVGPLRLHASYEKIFIGELSVDEWNLRPDNSGYENQAGDYKMDINNFMVGMDYQF